MAEKSYSFIGLLFFLSLCLSTCYTAKDTYTNSEGDSLQSDIQEYLRRITHQKPIYREPNFPAFLPGPLRPEQQQPSWRLPLPEQRDRIDDPYEAPAGEPDFLPSIGNEDRLQPWSRMPFPAPGLGAQSYASASARTFNSEADSAPNLDAIVDAKSAAYASVKDVDAEERLGEPSVSSQASAIASIITPDKKSPQPDQQTTIAEAFARKSEPSTDFLKQNEKVENSENGSFSDVYFVAIVAGLCAVAIFGVVSAGYCFYRIQKSSKAAAEVDYPAYGVTGPNKDVPSPNGDRKLAQSAQMYHYQHQKQQMIAVEKAGSTKNTSASDADSEEENEEGDYTVYECPGLAPTGEMEVKNPLFNDDSTPMSPPVLPSKPDGFQRQ